MAVTVDPISNAWGLDIFTIRYPSSLSFKPSLSMDKPYLIALMGPQCYRESAAYIYIVDQAIFKYGLVYGCKHDYHGSMGSCQGLMSLQLPLCKK